MSSSDEESSPSSVESDFNATKKEKTVKRNARLTKDAEVLKVKKIQDAQKRYAHLLGQTDIFAHFINMNKIKGSDLNALNAARSGDSKESKRRRKTEKEEDDELLQTENVDVEDTPLITESPSCKMIIYSEIDVTGGIMRDYQIQGLNWLISLFENGINGILADEMGLGKTLQSISFLGYLKHFKGMNGPHLIIVPKSTLHNWCNEFGRWVPSLNTFLFHGNKEKRSELIQEKLLRGNFEACVTSYEMCLLEKSALKKISWQYIMIDEAHRIKNENSSLSQIVRMFECRNRLLITGTPLQNNLHELWALLNFLLPDVFSSHEDFDRWFNDQGEEGNVVEQLHKVLRPFLLRRIKADVEKSLLPKKRINLYVGLSSMQRKWYQKLLEKDIEAVNGAIGGRKENKTRLQNIVMQLRKCCNHPYLFDGAEPGPPYTTDEHLVENAGKMVILDKLLLRLKAQNSRVLIFSQMSRMLDILEDYCVFRGYEYCRIDGSTAHEDRVSSIDAYNAPDSSKFIFLLTTRAGGLGINLATADTVVMYDNDWNPQVDLQAEDRVHRIGQKKQVVIFRFITENAIEEKVIDRASQKLQLDKLVIQQGRSNTNAGKAASKDELVSMIQYGAENIFNSADSTISNDDIEDILRKSEQKTAELEGKYKSMGFEDLQKLVVSDGTGYSAYNWEGDDFKKKAGIGMTWIGPSKRERKENGYSLQGGISRVSKERVPRLAKYIVTQEFQFWPARFIELQEREKYAYWKEVEYRPGRADEGLDDEEEAEILAENDKIESGRYHAIKCLAIPLTEAEMQEKEALSALGFTNWTKRDFVAFCKACEKYGRENLESIASEIEGKSLEEVKAYSNEFWERYREISDHEKIISGIEKGEIKLRRVQDVQELLAAKISKLRLPLQQLKIPYNQSKGKNFTEEEDRFLLVMLEKFGYGSEDVYDKIRYEIRRAPLFRFDWFIKSRTSVELLRRCGTLITMLSKESPDGEGEEKKRKKEDVVSVGSKKSKK